jgi:chromosome segregation ATPase
MPSVNSLHLQYRLWIAELNEDINVLRIFNDHLAEVSRNQNNKYAEQIQALKTKFAQVRNELDEIKHEMHLQKMKLAALAKTEESGVGDVKEKIQHADIASRYENFRKQFNDLKQAVVDLEED